MSGGGGRQFAKKTDTNLKVIKDKTILTLSSLTPNHRELRFFLKANLYLKTFALQLSHVIAVSF